VEALPCVILQRLGSFEKPSINLGSIAVYGTTAMQSPANAAAATKTKSGNSRRRQI
jgi:hypothetical protein